MNDRHPGIATGGQWRLRRAVAAEVRQKHQAALSACQNAGERDAVEREIATEIKEEMKRVASPYSLWISK